MKIRIVKAYGFLAVMYRCESCTLKKTEHKPRNWCFWTVVWRRDLKLEKSQEDTLKSILDCKEIKPNNPKGNQPQIFIIRIVAKAEALILWAPDVKSYLIEKDLDVGKDWRQKGRGWQRMRCLGSIIISVDMNLSKLWEIVEDKGAWSDTVHRVTKSWTQFSDWARTNLKNLLRFIKRK